MKLHQMCQQQTQRIKELEAELARVLSLLECGHPQADVVMGEDDAPGERVQWCERCVEIAAAIGKERARAVAFVRDWNRLPPVQAMAVELRNHLENADD